jgi:DNA-binding beta-propeller fold protein YncE
MRSLLVLTGLALAAAPLPGAEPAAPAAGLPLPAGAVRRFGDDRFRIAGAPLASALSPDGTRLAVLSFAQRRSQALMTVFDADTGRPVCRGSVDSADVFTTGRLAFSPDGKYVAAAIVPGVRVVWASHTGELVTKLPPSAFGPGLCQFTPEGLLAVTDRDRTDLYEIPSGEVMTTWPVGRIARLTADAKTFVRVEKDIRAISIGDAATGSVAGTLAVKTADNGTENGLAFSADGKMLAVVHDRERIQIWYTATRKQLGEVKLFPFDIDFEEPYHAVSFSPDGKTLVLETRGGEIGRWDTRSLKSLPALQAPGTAPPPSTRGVHWSKDGRTILAAVGGVHSSKDGRYILGTVTDGLLVRWDAKTGKELSEDDSNRRLCFAVTPNGSELIIGHLTGQIEVWDVATGRVVRRLAQGQESGHELVCLALSPDGRRLAVGEGHCHIRVFRTAGGVDGRRIMCPFRLDGGWMKSLAWAPDGKSLFADGSGMIVCRVNLADGETVWGVNDENMPCFSPTPDGRYVVKALWDSIQFLDASTGKECSEALPHCTPGGALCRLIGTAYNHLVGLARPGTLVPGSPPPPRRNAMPRPQRRTAPPRNHR